ncbi:XdhC family protein [Lysobacter sp. 2RAF19]
MLLREPSTDIDARASSLEAMQRAPFLAAGNPRPVLVAARQPTEDGVLAVVLETEGSTYVHAGAMAYFDAQCQVGWLSGGCLEPAIAQEAARSAATATVGWMEVDTRGDEDLLSGSAIGCRGRLRLALLPLKALGNLLQVIDAWLEGSSLTLDLEEEGGVRLASAECVANTKLPAEAVPWHGSSSWSIEVRRLPTVLLFGAGPEASALLRLLHELGWHTTLVERRERWKRPGAPVDVHIEATPSSVQADVDVALVMHHHFELDREALEALSRSTVSFIGLLGPKSRRDDLFKLLTPQQRVAIAPRLHSPVGLPLGGQGPEAIALSVASQLQAWRSTISPR